MTSFKGITRSLSVVWIIPLSRRPAKQQPELPTTLLKISLITKRTGRFRARSGGRNLSTYQSCNRLNVHSCLALKRMEILCTDSLKQSRSAVPLGEFGLVRNGEILSAEPGNRNVEYILFFVAGLS